MKKLSKNNQTFLYIAAVIIFIFILLALYGFYEKDKNVQLYKDFRANKKLICGDVMVQKSKGWRIKGNRFFSDGKRIKTIVFCSSYE